MEFSAYRQTPKEVQEEIIINRKKQLAGQR